METARFRFLRSVERGSGSVPALANLLQDMEETPGHTASCLSWRTSGSLQHIFHLTTLVPAHPLTADPHYDNWISADEGLLPVGLPCSSLLDLTNSTVAARANCLDFIHRLPPTGAVVVTLGRPGRHVAAALAATNYAIIVVRSIPSGRCIAPGGGKQDAGMNSGFAKTPSYGRPQTCAQAIQLSPPPRGPLLTSYASRKPSTLSRLDIFRVTGFPRTQPAGSRTCGTRTQDGW